MILPLKIAARFLKKSPGQTVLIALGIAIGVSVQIFIGLLIQGLQASLIDKTIGSSPHITVTSAEEGGVISDWEGRLDIILRAGGDIRRHAAASDVPAFIKANGKSEPVIVRGFTLDGADGIYKLKKSLTEGKMPDGYGKVLIGKELKASLGLSVGDIVETVTAEGRKTILKISGFYDLKVSSINKSWLVTSLKTSQELAGTGNTITSIELQVGDVFKADTEADTLRQALKGAGVTVSDWKSQNAQLLSGLNGQSISSLMIQVFVLVSVVLGIASVLAISVLQKSRQIGILKAMGIKDGTASRIFLFQGLLLGIAGAVAGILLGLGLIAMFTKFAVNPDNTPVVAIRTNYSFIALSGAIAVFAAVIASLIPAWNSSRLNPIEVIRNG